MCYVLCSQEYHQKTKELRRALQDLRDEKELSDAKAARVEALEEMLIDLRQQNRSLEEKINRLCEAPFISDAFGLHESKMRYEDLASERADRPSTDPDARARLFLRNEPGGDWGRAVVFREALTRAGQRCDSVDRQIMQRPGEWLVSCAPGYRYRFTFGPRGELERSERLP